MFVGEDDVKVNLIGLSEGITTGQTLEVVLAFEKAGDITVDVPVANPERAQERGDGFDFHETSGAASAARTARADPPALHLTSPELSAPAVTVAACPPPE